MEDLDLEDRPECTPPTISKAAILCRHKLEECLEIESLASQNWAENRLADFNLWDAGLGASSAEEPSLEARLAGKPHIGKVLLNLLIVYWRSIELCIELATGIVILWVYWIKRLTKLRASHTWKVPCPTRRTTSYGG
jgi:hypothetical protein